MEGVKRLGGKMVDGRLLDERIEKVQRPSGGPPEFVALGRDETAMAA